MNKMENRKNITTRINHYGKELYDEIFELAPIKHLTTICFVLGFISLMIGSLLKNTEIQYIANGLGAILLIGGLVLKFLQSTQKQENQENSYRKSKYEKL